MLLQDFEKVKASRIIKTRTHTIKQFDPLGISAMANNPDPEDVDGDNWGIIFEDFDDCCKFFDHLRTLRNPFAYFKTVAKLKKGFLG